MRARSVAVVLALALVAIAAPVSAAPVEHCVVEVVSQRPDGQLIMSQPTCFRTFGEASAHAQALEASGASGTSSLITPSSTFTLGIHYDGFNGTGSSITVVGSSCTGGWWNTTTVWDNRISSSYNGCYRLTHHDLPNKGGSSQSTVGAGATHNLSTMSDRAESVSYWSS